MFEESFVIADLETTGLSPLKNEIIEIGAIRVEKNKIVDKVVMFIKPEIPVSYVITNITGITNEMLKDAISVKEGLAVFMDFAKDYPLVFHNAKFDMGFLNNYRKKCFNSEFNNKCLDTLYISKQILKDVPNYKLGTLAEYFNISYNGAHRSLRDCEITFEVYKNLNKIYNEKNSLILN